MLLAARKGFSELELQVILQPHNIVCMYCHHVPQKDSWYCYQSFTTVNYNHELIHYGTLKQGTPMASDPEDRPSSGWHRQAKACQPVGSPLLEAILFAFIEQIRLC